MILIHGAWAESWVWDPIVPQLQAAGLNPVAVDLPGTPASGTGAHAGTLAHYVDAVIAAIPTAAAQVHLVGHSGGAVVATAVAERLRDQIASVAFVAGIMLPSGVSLPELSARAAATGHPLHEGVGPETVEVEIDGTSATVVPPEVGVAYFFQTAPEAAAIAASRRLVAQPDSGLMITPDWTWDGFGSIPRLYVEALQDRALPLYMQRFMQLSSPGSAVVSLDCDHAPQISATTDLAAALIGFASGASSARPARR